MSINLSRFIKAQEGSYPTALKEVKKQGHYTAIVRTRYLSIIDQFDINIE